MSNETPVYREGETVPVPDKGGWIDGETGEYAFGGPPPAPPVEPPVEPPVTRREDEPKPDRQAEPKTDQPAKAPSVPKR
jgi:hypothetical protein